MIGEYGIIAATVSYALYIMGLDFYTYSTREILSKDSKEWSFILSNHLLFAIFSFVLTSLFLSFLFYFEFIDRKWVITFYLLLFFENFSQELYRLLITFEMPIRASVLLFLRTGLWVVIICIIYGFDSNIIDLNYIFIPWNFGAGLSCLLGAYWIFKESWFIKTNCKIDIIWILKGVNISKTLLMHTLCVKLFFVIDKYIILFFTNAATVGIYTFYSAFANALTSFIDAMVISANYPQMIKSFNKSTTTRTLKNKIEIEIDFNSAILSVCISLFVFIYVSLYKDVFFQSNYPLIVSLLISSYFYNRSIVSHIVLYANRRDTEIMNLSIMSVVIFLVVSICVSYMLGVWGVIIGLMVVNLYLWLYQEKIAIKL